MIAYIKGTVESIEIDSIIVESYGIGYEMFFPSVDRVTIGQNVHVYTYQHIREDENTLFGFFNKAEKQLFVRLISVKGVGPKTVMGMLRFAKYHDIIQAIEGEDVVFIKSMPGIGAKSASQIILDLKGKLVAPADAVSQKVSNQALSDALEALKALGYKTTECNQVSKHLSTIGDKTSDEYIRAALLYFQGIK